MHRSKGVQKAMLIAWNFIKNKICHRFFDNNLQKLFRTKILKNSNEQILLIVVSMVDLWLEMEIVDKMILYLLVFLLYISPFELQKLNLFAEARPGSRRATKINLFARIVKVFKSTLLTIFVKSIIMSDWRALITPLVCSNAFNYLTLSWRRSLS